VNLFDNSFLFRVGLFDVRQPEDDLRRSKDVGMLVDCMWKCIFNTCAFVGIKY
jgi:hypothetical protein